MDLQSLIPYLKTDAPSEIFKKIVAFNMKGDAGSRAVVRLGLGSGYSVQGTPLKDDEKGNVVFVGEDGSVGYINANTVLGIQVLNPQSLVEVLTDRARFNIDATQVPTALQLKREFKSLGDFLNDRYNIALSSDALENELDTDAEKYQFRQFLNILQNSISDVADDGLGQEALELLSNLNITTSENPLQVEKEDGGGISIGIDFSQKFADDLKGNLKKEIESKL